MSLFNSDGQMSKGFEMLLRQVLKMMNFDPELIVGQINAIHGLLKTHVEQQTEILLRLERIENGQRERDDNNKRGDLAA